MTATTSATTRISWIRCYGATREDAEKARLRMEAASRRGWEGWSTKADLR